MWNNIDRWSLKYPYFSSQISSRKADKTELYNVICIEQNNAFRTHFNIEYCWEYSRFEVQHLLTLKLPPR